MNVTPVPTGNLQAVIAGGTTVTAPVTLTICPGEEVTFTEAAERPMSSWLVQRLYRCAVRATPIPLEQRCGNDERILGHGQLYGGEQPLTITYAGNR